MQALTPTLSRCLRWMGQGWAMRAGSPLARGGGEFHRRKNALAGKAPAACSFSGGYAWARRARKRGSNGASAGNAQRVLARSLEVRWRIESRLAQRGASQIDMNQGGGWLAWAQYSTDVLAGQRSARSISARRPQRYNGLMRWRARYDAELEKAERARARGNEGQARVCARRAAGVVAAEYYARRGFTHKSGSALDVLSQLRGDPSLPRDLLPDIDDLLQQVNAEFKLAPGVDLIAVARRLREELVSD